MYPRTFVHLRGTRVRVMTPQQEASLGPGWFAEDQQWATTVSDSAIAVTAPEPVTPKRGRPRKR